VEIRHAYLFFYRLPSKSAAPVDARSVCHSILALVYSCLARLHGNISTDFTILIISDKTYGCVRMIAWVSKHKPMSGGHIAVCQLNTDPMSDGSRRSDMLIGGVIGGTAAAVVGAVIIIVIVRLCRQWSQYQKAVQSALGELQYNSPDGDAITPSTARRASLVGMFFLILLSSFCAVSGCSVSVIFMTCRNNFQFL